MPKRRKKRVSVVITDKAQLSRLLTLLRELKQSSYFQLQVILGGSALTYRYGNITHELNVAGFPPDARIPMAIEGGEHLGMAKTAALGMLEFATAFDNLRSDYVVVRGDRFEVLPIATAAAYMNKTLVHIEGGDRTGSIDESVRHAVTKLAHVHFVTNEASRRRVVRLGELKEFVFNVGSLDIDFLQHQRLPRQADSALVNQHGVGAVLDLREPYIIVMQNPVTTEAAEARRQVSQTLSAVLHAGLQVVWIWPNMDAGSDAMSKKIREWQVRHTRHRIRFIRYLEPSDFVQLLHAASAVVGNSSTGIKECSWLGVPVVNIGTRQHGRLRAQNVINADYDHTVIARALARQLRHGRYPQSTIYGNGSTAKKIVRTLREISPPAQKYNAY